MILLHINAHSFRCHFLCLMRTIEIIAKILPLSWLRMLSFCIKIYLSNFMFWKLNYNIDLLSELHFFTFSLIDELPNELLIIVFLLYLLSFSAVDSLL